MTQLQIAEQIVKIAFKDKFDKGGERYEKHLSFVRDSILKTHPHINEHVQCIALLHDLLEDCPEWNETSLKRFFSDRVISGIIAITKSEGENYESYIQRLSSNGDAVLVKIHDLRHNMDITRIKDLSEKDIERLLKYHSAYKFLTSI